MSERWQVILVKHAMPVVDPSLPAHEWKLSDAGRKACSHFARRLAEYRPSAIASSPEGCS